jgi:regulatory protein
LLKKLADEKYNSLKGEQYLIRKKKTMDYLLGRGFEMELIRQVFEKE